MRRLAGHASLWPSRRAARVFTAALVLAVVVALFLLVVLTGAAGSARLRAGVADAISGPLAILATVALGSAAARSQGRARQAWGLLTVGTGLWAVGETFWWLVRLLPDLPVIDGLDDVFYLVGTPFVVAGAACFPVAAWRGADRYRAVLDGVVVGGSLLFGFGVLGLFDTGTAGLREQLLAAAYPSADVAVLFVAVTVVLRAPRRLAVPLGLVVAALALFALGDVVYAVQVAQGSYVSGTPLDLTWNLAYLLLGLGALAPLRPTPAEPSAAAGYHGRVLPWVVVGLALAALTATVLVQPEVLRNPWLAAVTGAVGVVATARQAWFVADLSRLNSRLERHAARVERMADAVVDAILVVDRGGRIAYANDPATTLLGRTRLQLTGRPITDLMLADEAGRTGVREAMGTTRSVVQAAATFLRADGSPVPVDVSVGPIDHRSPSGMILVFRDASAQRQLERLKNEFMSVVSHEVRTPLTSIRGALTLLDGGVSGELPPAAARMVHIALESSDRLSRLINDILDAERLESGYVHLDRRPVAAAALVERAVFEMGGQAASADVEVVAGSSEGVVVADADRIVQVLTNLVGNAVKFSPKGSRVRVGATPVGETVELWVADRGRGIPAAKQLVVFDRYQQVDASDARQQGGTGLGLAICRDLVTLHGGRIWVDSEVGVGSEFRFSLPAGRAAAVEPPTAPAEAAAQQAQQPSPAGAPQA